MRPVADEGSLADGWLRDLRERLLQVARRRVPADAAEDLVQEALRIIIERRLARPGATTAEGVPALASCFQVLRNVIGNHYQRAATERRRLDPAGLDTDRPDPGLDPLAVLARDEAERLVRACLGDLAATDASCARYLSRLADGHSPREIAREERLAEPALYRRVYRCRLKLRVLLKQRGFFA